MKWMTQSGPAQRKRDRWKWGSEENSHSRGSLTSRKSKREIIFATPRLAPTPVAHAEAESWSEIDEIELLGRRRQICVESRQQQSRAARTHGCFQSLPELAFVSQRKKFGSSLSPISGRQRRAGPVSACAVSRRALCSSAEAARDAGEGKGASFIGPSGLQKHGWDRHFEARRGLWCCSRAIRDPLHFHFQHQINKQPHPRRVDIIVLDIHRISRFKAPHFFLHMLYTTRSPITLLATRFNAQAAPCAQHQQWLESCSTQNSRITPPGAHSPAAAFDINDFSDFIYTADTLSCHQI